MEDPTLPSKADPSEGQQKAVYKILGRGIKMHHYLCKNLAWFRTGSGLCGLVELTVSLTDSKVFHAFHTFPDWLRTARTGFGVFRTTQMPNPHLQQQKYLRTMVPDW